MPKKVLSGVAVSKKTKMTVIVEVVRTFMHPKYKKTVKSRKNYAVHDEMDKFKEGDLVTFIECKPISKTKRWTVLSE